MNEKLKLLLALGLGAAVPMLSACEKEVEPDPVIVVDEPCEDKGTCEPTD